MEEVPRSTLFADSPALILQLGSFSTSTLAGGVGRGYFAC
jgi:hypothetical protein